MKGYLMTIRRTAPQKAPHILHINASSLYDGSQTRKLSQYLVEQITANTPGTTITSRDVAEGLPFIDEAWVTANFTPAEDHRADQKETLTLSDQLIEELIESDIIIMAVPLYNFSIPASLKAWIDQVARVRKTFHYTEEGPKGLLTDKKAYLIAASGGTAIGGELDFATPYLKHILAFMGITDVTIIAADALMADAEEKISAARSSIEHHGKKHQITA
tara:strand:+ start:15899 stop:16552 length:654 start_codon:yes stop_codon:yes gene_type:complete